MHSSAPLQSVPLLSGPKRPSAKAQRVQPVAVSTFQRQANNNFFNNTDLEFKKFINVSYLFSRSLLFNLRSLKRLIGCARCQAKLLESPGRNDKIQSLYFENITEADTHSGIKLKGELEISCLINR